MRCFFPGIVPDFYSEILVYSHIFGGLWGQKKIFSNEKPLYTRGRVTFGVVLY